MIVAPGGIADAAAADGKSIWLPSSQLMSTAEGLQRVLSRTESLSHMMQTNCELPIT